MECLDLLGLGRTAGEVRRRFGKLILARFGVTFLSLLRTLLWLRGISVGSVALPSVVELFLKIQVEHPLLNCYNKQRNEILIS